MPTNQELRQASARSLSGTAFDYNSDLSAMFTVAGIASGLDFNSRLLLWLNAQLSASYTNLPQAQQAYAISKGVTSWDDVTAFGSAYVAPLDLVTGTKVALWGLRLMRSGYAGNCIKVRRSSDSTTQDIGFVNNVLDTASLLAFCGSGDGFVDTWYDQSGLGLNATQATAGSQPRIVSAGVVETVNSKPTIRFLGVGYKLATVANSGNFPTELTHNFVGKVVNNSANANGSVEKTTTNVPQPFDQNGNLYTLGTSTAGTNFCNMTTAFTNTNPLSVYSMTAKTGSQLLFLNGAANGSYSFTYATLNDPSCPIVIGSRADTFTSLDGHMSEIALLSTSISTADRQALEGNQKTYFGTP